MLTLLTVVTAKNSCFWEVKVSDQAVSRVDKFLASATKKPAFQRGNLIFALDATASREKTWDSAVQLQAGMFREAATIGALNVQLVFYRGMDGFNGECKASQWVSDPMMLAKFMAPIRCEAGETQIAKVLNHALSEAQQRKIGALVFIGDACEEDPEQIMGPARKLGQLGVPVFLFQEGRNPVAETYFQDIAKITRGAWHRFDHDSAALLGELLRAVAAFAVGGVTALEKQGSGAARLLLGQLR
ncbi:VWA domain-containing protein [Bradyrhizobium sp. USDA 10063]